MYRLISFHWIPHFKRLLIHYYRSIVFFYKPRYVVHHYRLIGLNSYCIPEEALYNNYNIVKDGYIIRHTEYMSDMTAIYPQFINKYKVYCHFKQQGFYVYSGINYAVDYMLYTYPRHQCHSSYGVLVEPEYTMFDIHRAQRVIHHVRKKLLICFIDNNKVNQLVVQRFTMTSHR